MRAKKSQKSELTKKIWAVIVGNKIIKSGVTYLIALKNAGNDPNAAVVTKDVAERIKQRVAKQN